MIKKIDPALKAKWIKALRSGDYKQGTDCLRSNTNQYCCLGVACDLIDPALWADGGADRWEWDGIEDNLPQSAVVLEATGIEMPINLMVLVEELYRLDQLQPRKDGLAWEVYFTRTDTYFATASEDHGIILATLNDNGITFDTIAQLIEDLF